VNLATWWLQKESGTTYWRCRVPAKHLPGQTLHLKHSDVRLKDGEAFIPRQQGVAIWQTPGNITRSLIMAEQQEQGIRVLMEVDDNYLASIPQVPNGVSEWVFKHSRDGSDPHSIETHRRIAKWIDGVIVSTPRLAEAYAPFNENVYVCPNSIDTQDWPDPEKPDDGIFHIGFAGSKSHFYDYSLVERALSWAEDQPNVEIVIYGLKERGPIKKRWIEWTHDLGEYRRSLGLLDVGVCPLKPGIFNDCKSDIKAMEYAMAGALPIVSKTEAYRPWWDKPCLVAETEKDFRRHIKWCVQNRDEVKRLAAEAKAYVLAERRIEQHISKWEEAVSG
jgi:O-antigen biosynthesis protein